MDGAWGVPVSVRLAVANWPSDAGHGAVAEFCRTQGISRSWFYALWARARGDGPVAVVKPRSRRPRSSPSRIDPALEQLALQLRADLLADGWDGGPISVRQAMLDAGIDAPSRSSLARIFARAGVVTPSPSKRPISSRRFTYPAPNECWQLDGFDHVLANGARACVLQVIDDHSRVAFGSIEPDHGHAGTPSLPQVHRSIAVPRGASRSVVARLARNWFTTLDGRLARLRAWFISICASFWS